MYRAYENPRELENRLDEAKERLEELRTKVNNGEADFDELVDAQLNVDELAERVNFAWQDEEYEEDYARENGLLFDEEFEANYAREIINPYHTNPLDDEWDDDVDDYTFDIPSDAF